jgi:hypothetical protein
MVPLMHRVRRYKTLHYEFRPEPRNAAESRSLRRVS